MHIDSRQLWKGTFFVFLWKCAVNWSVLSTYVDSVWFVCHDIVSVWLQLVASSRAAVVIHCTELSRVVASDLSLSLGTSHTLVNAVLAAAAVSRCVSLPVTVALWSTDAICWCWWVALCWAALTVSAVFPVSSNSVFLTDFWCFNSSWLHVETETFVS